MNWICHEGAENSIGFVENIVVIPLTISKFYG